MAIQVSGLWNMKSGTNIAGLNLASGTYSVWMYSTLSNPAGFNFCLLNKNIGGSNPDLRINLGIGPIYMNMYDASSNPQTATHSLTANQIALLCMTWDKSAQLFYYNGVRINASGNDAGTLLNVSDIFTIGCTQTFGPPSFTYNVVGISQPTIHDTVLSPTDIANIYAGSGTLQNTRSDHVIWGLTLNGPVGNVPQSGDAGLINVGNLGVGSQYNMINFTGITATGTAVYIADFAPSQSNIQVIQFRTFIGNKNQMIAGPIN